MALYVKFKKPRTVRQFLKKFFGDNETYNGIYYSAPTFLDKECKISQCRDSRRRSFDDIYELVNTYYSNISKKKLLHTLITLKINTKDKKTAIFNFHYCYDIKKAVMYYQSVKYGWEEWRSFENKKQKCKYSWRELMNIMNIHNKKQLLEYQKKFKVK